MTQSASKIEREAARRRTFAIISHPDAGKTTLTENMLSAAGAIRLAGAVRARGEQRRTRSDWMKIERERGISVSASVMTFEHRECMFNLLDTPGHEDFSEDTYRTVTAADAAIMVLDAAKGIEPQTLKLFEVCRLRGIPILTFINKMDREAEDIFALLDQIQDQLALDASPQQWPAGSGSRFAGMRILRGEDFLIYPRAQDDDASQRERVRFDDDQLAEFVEPDTLTQLREESEIALEGYPEFDRQAFLDGDMTPVYFGSALRKFGINQLLDALADYSPPPAPVETESGETVAPGDDEVSGFVFKVQANMDPNHRDRVAFMRLCSGEFKRGMKLRTATSARQITVSSPILFFAQDREIVDEAYAGDVIGVPNHGVLRVGDSLSENGKLRFVGIPNFAPEILRRARTKDPLKAKHLRKALESLAEEGVTQLFKPALGAEMIVGAVGPLQIDVMAERIEAEYGLEVVFEQPAYTTARWLGGADADIENFLDRNKSQAAEDLDGSPVYLAKNAWEISYAEEKFPAITFLKAKERVL